MGLFDKIKSTMGIKSPLEQKYIGTRVECVLQPEDENYELLQNPSPWDIVELEKKYWVRPGMECEICNTLLFLQTGLGTVDSLFMHPCPKCGGTRFVIRKKYAQKHRRYV